MKIKPYVTTHSSIWMLISILCGVSIGYIAFLMTKQISIFQILFLFLVGTIGVFAIRSLRVSFYLFLFTLPLNAIGATYISLSIKLWYIFFCFLIVSIGYTIVKLKEQKEDVVQKIKSAIDIPLLLFLCIIIISVFQSKYIPPNPPMPWPKLIYYPWIKSISKVIFLGGCFCIYYVTLYVVNNKEKIRKYIQIHASIVSFFALYALIAFSVYIFTGVSLSITNQPVIVQIPEDIPRIMGTEKEPVFFGFYLMTLLPVLYAIIVAQFSLNKEEAWYNKHVIIGITLLITLALVGTGSRSAILAFFLSLITLLFLFKGERTYVQYCKDILHTIKVFLFSSKKGKAVAIIIILIIGFLGITYKDSVKEGVEKTIIIPIIGTFDKSYGKFWSTKTRLIAYEYARDAFKQHPWLGIGYENFNFYSGNKVYYGLIAGNTRWAEVNNYPLKVLAELGIIGFLFFLFFVVSFFYYLLRGIKQTKDYFLKTIMQGYLASFIGIAIILLFSSVIILPYLWVSMGIAIAAVRAAENSNAPPSKNEEQTI